MKQIIIALFLISTIISAQSLKKRFAVKEKIEGGSGSIGEDNVVEYSIVSGDGRLIYKISNKTDYDIPYSKLEVFNNGYSVLINSFYGTLTFFNNNGTRLTETKLSTNIGVEYERSIKSAVDNNTLLILFNQQENKFSTIQKYNYIGIIELNFVVDVLNVNGLAYSETLNQIYLSHIEWDQSGGIKKAVSLINENGELLKKYNSTFEKGFFAENNQFIAFSNKSLIAINSDNLEIYFQKKPAINEIFIDVTSAVGATVAVSAKPPILEDSKWYYKNLTIKKLSLSGKTIESRDVVTSLFSEYGFNWLDSKLKFIVGSKHVNVE